MEIEVARTSVGFVKKCSINSEKKDNSNNDAYIKMLTSFLGKNEFVQK
jgi:hypothetical protein